MRPDQQYLYKEGTTPQTRTVVSSKVKIFSYGYGLNAWQQIAVVGTMGQSHGRGADPVRGVGFGDQIAELVPSVSDPVTLSFTRTAIYTAMLQQVFGYAGGVDGIVRSLKHHRWPFDVKEEIVISEIEHRIAQNLAGPNAVVPAKYKTTGQTPPLGNPIAIATNYLGCWFTSLSRDYASDSSIVAENADVSCTDIVDPFATYGEFIRTGNSPTEGGQMYSEVEGNNIT